MQSAPFPCQPPMPEHLLPVSRAVVPQALQAEVVMLVPKLVEQGEHTAAAGALLGRLAEAAREVGISSSRMHSVPCSVANWSSAHDKAESKTR